MSWRLRGTGAFRSAVVTCAIGLGWAAAAETTGANVLNDKLRDARVEGRQLDAEMDRVDARQDQVVRQVSALNGQIADLRGPVSDLEIKIGQLDYRIGRRHVRIRDLKTEYREQARVIVRLDRELVSARRGLQSRVVAAYMHGGSGMVAQLAGSGSVEDFFTRKDALDAVVGLDKGIVDRIASSERQIRLKRSQNHIRQKEVRDDIAKLEADKSRVEAERAVLSGKQRDLAGAVTARDALLSKLKSRESELGRRLDDVESDARLLQKAIKNGQSTLLGRPGAFRGSQMAWPVNGFIASPFGPRWGRMHEGLDLAVPAGTPIVAAASGVVIHAGWMGGYGNQVVIQHGGGVTTSYAHQSRISSSLGQAVEQGQVIGYVGCTGSCFGDHTHFETRVNGAAEDPMRYL